MNIKGRTQTPETILQNTLQEGKVYFTIHKELLVKEPGSIYHFDGLQVQNGYNVFDTEEYNDFRENHSGIDCNARMWIEIDDGEVKSILFETALSHFKYLFKPTGEFEYSGAYHGFMHQNILLKFTVEEISEVESTLGKFHSIEEYKTARSAAGLDDSNYV